MSNYDVSLKMSKTWVEVLSLGNLINLFNWLIQAAQREYIKGIVKFEPIIQGRSGKRSL